MVTVMKLFLKYKPIRIAYYAGLAAVYMFGVTALAHAFVAVMATFH
jgi:hypothetical protein